MKQIKTKAGLKPVFNSGKLLYAAILSISCSLATVLPATQSHASQAKQSASAGTSAGTSNAKGAASGKKIPSLQGYAAVQPTIAGISSGGFMAVQMSVAYSATFKGTAIFAGGPYYCAADNLMVAASSCMANVPAITQAGLDLIETDTNLWADFGWIDHTSNLTRQKIYLYSGTNDSTVTQGVVDWLQSYYKNYLPASNINYNNTSAAGHSWVTWKTGNGINPCSVTGSPFINNCNNDPEHDLIAQLYGSVNPRASTASGTLLPFDQSAFVPAGQTASYSIDTTGYIYVPPYCAANSGCKVMLALHGCQQGYGTIKDVFINNAGLNEYADTNQMLVIYPQLIASATIPYNPKGCWDFWGYTGSNYALQSGIQPGMLKAIVTQVMRPHSKK